jgi:hypothetical protein
MKFSFNKYWLNPILFTGALENSFLDRKFGPIECSKHKFVDVKAPSQFLHIIGYDDGDDFIHIPSKDYTDDLTPVAEPQYAGIATFSHLPLTDCLNNASEIFDIAVLEAPFDTGVSYRP